MIDCNITKNYLSEQARMTKSSDVGVCRSRFNNDEEMLCTELELRHPEKAIAIVQKWSDEHPQRTYLSEFLKNYPNAKLDEDGTPHKLCPWHLGLISVNSCHNNCVRCWNQPVKKKKKMAFPEKLKSLRLKHKLTQTGLGEKLYVSRSTISNYEKGKFEPNIQTLIEMSKLFNIPIDELLK